MTETHGVFCIYIILYSWLHLLAYMTDKVYLRTTYCQLCTGILKKIISLTEFLPLLQKNKSGISID
jgi:hypothetical protein